MGGLGVALGVATLMWRWPFARRLATLMGGLGVALGGDLYEEKLNVYVRARMNVRTWVHLFLATDSI